MEIFFLCAAAFFAGFIDSVVGGGGLIQLPALFIILSDTEIATVAGTNKFSSFAGTSIAVVRYAQAVSINWRATLPAALTAFCFSFLGARVVSLTDKAVLRPLILLLLIVVASYTFLKKDFGALHAPKLSAEKEQWYGIAVGVALGFYDGFFGPGTGSFLIFIFIGIFGMNFLSASASSKAINFATNLAAVLYFGATGHILYSVALPMAACNVLGSLVGTRLAIAKGSAFVRALFLVVVTGIILKFGYDTVEPWLANK